MAVSCIRRNVYSTLQLIFVIQVIITPLSTSFSPTDIVTKDLLKELCSQTTRSTHFCVKWLNADIKKTSMNVHGLIELTVEKTRALGLNNLALVTDLARGAGNDKQLKSAYESCADGYGIAIKKLEEAKGFLRNSSFQQAGWAAAKALEYAYVCKDQFEGPSNEPPLVLNRSEKFITMCSVTWCFNTLFN